MEGSVNRQPLLVSENQSDCPFVLYQKFCSVLHCVITIHQHYRQTDRQTSCSWHKREHKRDMRHTHVALIIYQLRCQSELLAWHCIAMHFTALYCTALFYSSTAQHFDLYPSGYHHYKIWIRISLFSLLLFPAGFWHGLLFCLHLDLSEIKSFSAFHYIMQQLHPFPTHHFSFYNVMEEVLMSENTSKPSMLPVPNCFQYAPSFIGTYQHLFICHRLCPTDFQHPPPCPHFRCFQQRLTCFSQCPGLCCIQCYIPNCSLLWFASFAHSKFLISIKKQAHWQTHRWTRIKTILCCN